MTKRYMMTPWKSDLNMENIILRRQFFESHPGVDSKIEDGLKAWTNGTAVVLYYNNSVDFFDKLGMTGGVFSPDSVIPIKDGVVWRSNR